MTDEQKERYAKIGEELGVKLPPLGTAPCKEVFALLHEYEKLVHRAGLYHQAFHLQKNAMTGEE